MKKIVCCFLIINFIFFSGCVEKDIQSSKNEKIRNYIVCNFQKTPKDLIMLNEYDIREQDLITNLFEGLVRIDETGKIATATAESWALSKDETCYTFKIKDNARWSDGSSITAEDFVDFFREILSKNTDNIYAEQLYCIFGVEDYRKGKCDFNNVAIRAVDKKSLEIRLNYPCCYFLNLLAEPIYGIRKINSNLKDWKKEYKNILYSGYFVIDSFQNNNEMILKRNKCYWNSDNVKSEKIHLLFNEESEAALAAFQNSKVDLFTNPPINEVKNLANSGNIIEQPCFSAEALIFNLKKENVVRDENFRKAISECIDRNEISKKILNDSVKPALRYIPSGVSDGMSGFYINKEFFSSTIQKDKALNLIKNSKYDKNNLKIIYLNTIENKKTCESIVKSLKENLDVKVECQGYNTEEFNDEIRKNDYDIAEIQYEGVYNYPLSFLEKWKSSSEENFYGYKNLEFDNILINLKMEKSKDKKMEMLRTAENTLMQDMPIVPLYFNDIVICKKSKVKGISISKKGNLDLHALEMVK